MRNGARHGSGPVRGALRLLVVGVLLLFLTAGVGKRCLYALPPDLHDADSRAPVVMGRPPPPRDGGWGRG